MNYKKYFTIFAELVGTMFKREIRKGFYETNNSDLLIHVVNIAYQNDEYVKAKIQLSNKKNYIAYDIRPKYYKILKNNIKHWFRTEDPRGVYNKNGTFAVI